MFFDADRARRRHHDAQNHVDDAEDPDEAGLRARRRDLLLVAVGLLVRHGRGPGRLVVSVRILIVAPDSSSSCPGGDGAAATWPLFNWPEK